MKLPKQAGSIESHNTLVSAVKKYLDLKNIFYFSSWGARCQKCGAIQRVSPAGCDIAIVSHMIEVKTGKSGSLTPRQKLIREKAERYGVEYTVVKDTMDALLEIL